MASITRFYALILSTVLLLSGVPGFFPNIVAFQPLVTFFALTLTHAAVHAGVGVLGLLITALASDESVRIYTLGLALLYGVLAAVGIAGIDLSPFLAFNAADIWLHGAIFVLSLGIFLAGLTEERLRQRKLRILGGMPSAAATTSPPISDWRLDGPISRPSGRPVSHPGPHPVSHPGMMPSQPGRWSEANSETYTRPPWQPAPADERSGSNLWVQSPWPDSQQAPVPPRDPWTREQRHSPAQPPSQPPSQPPVQPWPQYPPPQNPWPPSAPPSSQPSPNFGPSENPWAWEPQAPDQGQQP